MLLKATPASERWFVFNKRAGHWRHAGSTVYPKGVLWGIVSPYQVESILECHSKPGDIVLDPFTGADNIPKLARSMNRIGIGSDVDEARPKFPDYS
jgi:hypothetical protein